MSEDEELWDRARKILARDMPLIVRTLVKWRSEGLFTALTGTMRLDGGDMVITAAEDGTVVANVGGQVIDVTPIVANGWPTSRPPRRR